MKKVVCFAVFILFATLAQGQNRRNDDLPSLEDMQRRMLELQREMFREFRDSPFREFFNMPDGPGRDSTRSYQLDTTYSDGSRMYFRRFFGPMTEGDSTHNSDDFFRGFGRMFEELDHLNGDAPGIRRFDRNMPKDDGQLEPEDGLLPEERLRLEEENKKPGDPGAPKQDKPAARPEKKKSKIKSERI
jgi:hypothetical protein